MLILAGFAFIFQGHLHAMRDLAGGFGDISPFDSALRFMSLAPCLLMIIPAAMIILGVVIIVKGKKYGESIE